MTTVKQHERREAHERRMAKRQRRAMRERITDNREPFFIDEPRPRNRKVTLADIRIARDVAPAQAVALMAMNGVVR